MQLGQQRLELHRLRPGRSFWVRAAGKVAGRAFLRCFRRQQSFHVSVLRNQPRQLQTSFLHKSAAQMDIMPQIIDAQLQALQRKVWAHIRSAAEVQSVRRVRPNRNIGMGIRGIVRIFCSRRLFGAKPFEGVAEAPAHTPAAALSFGNRRFSAYGIEPSMR